MHNKYIINCFKPMVVARFIPENPHEPPNIPVDDMNNGSYIYGPTKTWFEHLPLCWYPDELNGLTSTRYDLRVLPDEELAKLGWTPCPIPEFNNETHFVEFNKETLTMDVIAKSSRPEIFGS